MTTVRPYLWLLLSLAPFAFLAGLTVTLERNAEVRQASTEAVLAASTIAKMVDATAGREEIRLRALGFDRAFASAVERRSIDRILDFLAFVRHDPAWAGAMVVEEGGRVLASVGNVQNGPALGDLTMPGLSIQPATAVTGARIVMVESVLSLGEHRGTIVGIYTLSSLEEVLGRAVGASRTMLTDRHGRVLAGPLERIGNAESLEGLEAGERAGDGASYAVRPVLDGNFRIVSAQEVGRDSALLVLAITSIGLQGLGLAAAMLFWSRRLRLRELELKRQRRERQAISELALDATLHLDRDRAVRMAGSRAAELIKGVTRSAVALTQPDGRHVLLFHAYPIPGTSPVLLEIGANRVLSRALNHGRREAGPTSVVTGGWEKELDVQGNQQCWAPLLAHGRVFGALFLQLPARRDPLDVSEVMTVEAIAATLAGTLESQQRLSELTYQGAMLGTVLDGSPDGLAAFAPDGRVVLDNVAFRRLVRSNGSTVGLSLDDLMALLSQRQRAVETNFDTNAYFRRALEGERLHGRMKLHDGRDWREVDTLLAPLLLPTGEAGALFTMRDLSERQELEKIRRLHAQVAALLQDESRRAALLDQVLAASGVGLVFVDPPGHVTYANALFWSLFGLEPRSGLTRRSLLELLQRRVPAMTDNLLEAGGELETDEPRRILELRSVEVRAADGSAVGRLLSVRDHTAQRELERARDAFIGVAAHELRGPVAAMVLLAQVALRSRDGRREETLGRIEARAKDLSALIDRLLDVTRADLGKIDLDRTVVDVAALASSIVEPYLLQSLPVYIECEKGLYAWADPVRARQIVTNLLSNAIRYGLGQPVTVRVEARGNSEVAIAVVDNGPGINPADLRRIFGRFQQGSTVGRGAGLGVGLYLAKRLAEAHGGRIEVESVERRGSTFTAVLPRADAPAATLGDGPERHDEEGTTSEATDGGDGPAPGVDA